MSLQTLWFIVIAVLWIGFFVLEGFDMGVGMLHGVIARGEEERRAAINSIGPVWDANEVWLIVAAAGMFAAFPGWYATMFSGFYLLMVLILAGLIARGVSFEFRGKVKSPRWAHSWDVAMSVGSLVVAVGLGVALGNLLHGVPVGSNQEYTGNFWDLLQPYPLFTGLTILALCLVHGSTFLALKTEDDLRKRASRWAAVLAPIAAVMLAAWVVWTHASQNKGFLPNPIEATTVLAIIAVAWLASEGAEGWAFAATTVALAGMIGSIFVNLYPRVLVSSTNSSYNLTISNTASGSYTLKVMTVVALVLLPVVLAYQVWSYRVFHRRVSAAHFAPAVTSEAPAAPAP
jgi:cytochrome bd-type quinol oxidase subunit 2